MSIALMFIIWTWGLTPTWVNVVVTIICSTKILLKTVAAASVGEE